ncbi:MAG TPA: GNAT family N-acetyltransferase [Thermoplasmata archaeon]|nr:GNAT family N-acetyltransferase [Thermoplasmata archaeon]
MARPPTSATSRSAVSVRSVRTAREIAIARALIREYARSIGVDLEFQGFREEIRSLPGEYRPPWGGLWIAWTDGRPIGCVALRRWAPRKGEMKRLYVRPNGRRHGTGRRLAETVVRAARRREFEWIYLDTLGTMSTALRLYASMGFRETRPYRPNPIPGCRFLRLRLSARGPFVGRGTGPIGRAAQSGQRPRNRSP